MDANLAFNFVREISTTVWIAAVLCITLTILIIPSAYQAIVLQILNPFVIVKGKHKGQKAPLLGIYKGSFPFGHVKHKVSKPILVSNDTVDWCERTGIYSWVEFILLKPTLLVTSPEACKRVLSASITVKKSTRNIGSLIPAWELLFGKGLFMLPPKDWKRIHTISMRSFGSAQTKAFYPIINEVVLQYISSLRHIIQGKRVVKHGTMLSQLSDCRYNKQGSNNFTVDRLFRPLSLTAICNVAFGSGDGDGVKIELIQKHFREIILLQQNAPYAILSLIPGYLKYFPFGKPLFMRNTIKSLHKLSLDFVTKYRSKQKDARKNIGEKTITGSEERKTLIKVLCDAHDTEEGSLTDTEVVHNVFSFMAAGMSTTADSLAHMILELAQSKQVLQRLQNDIDKIVLAKKYIDNVTWEDIDSCNYLTAVIKETLRLYPSIGTVAPRILIEDVEIDGIYCPKGSSVSIGTLVAHRLAFNRVVKNGDGKIFRPERWEEDYVRRQTEGVKFPSNDYSFITFSAGVRPCIGRHMSLMEMKCVLFHFVYNFDFSLPNDTKFDCGDPRKLKLPVIAVKENVNVVINIRKTK